MEMSGLLHVSVANPRTESLQPIGLKAKWRPKPALLLRVKKRFAGYGNINCMYAFLICRFKTFPWYEVFQNIVV
jgi:hypothetical protein